MRRVRMNAELARANSPQELVKDASACGGSPTRVRGPMRNRPGPASVCAMEASEIPEAP
jgi:hypothetical protein